MWFSSQVWDDADAEALRLARTGGLTYIPPFDHPLLWYKHELQISFTLSASRSSTFLVPRRSPSLTILNLLRQGHASMIAETAASLGPDGKPGAVVISVGGGGLLCGVVQGLRDVGWADVPIIAMETVGADCFNAAIKAGRLVTLDDITR